MKKKKINDLVEKLETIVFELNNSEDSFYKKRDLIFSIDDNFDFKIENSSCYKNLYYSLVLNEEYLELNKISNEIESKQQEIILCLLQIIMAEPKLYNYILQNFTKEFICELFNAKLAHKINEIENPRDDDCFGDIFDDIDDEV